MERRMFSTLALTGRSTELPKASIRKTVGRDTLGPRALWKLRLLGPNWLPTQTEQGLVAEGDSGGAAWGRGAQPLPGMKEGVGGKHRP